MQGFAGTPVDVNALTYDYLIPVGAAGATFPQPGDYYVAVDAGRSLFTGKSLAGRYVLRSWVNDVTPPTLRLLTTRVSAGRPTLVFRTLDRQSGVDPLSLTIGFKGALVAVGSYDWQTGIAVFPLPTSVPTLAAGTTVATSMLSSDFQEAKNIDTTGSKLMPNTRTATVRLQVVAGVAVDWLAPAQAACVVAGERLVVAASAPAAVSTVRFAVDGRRGGVDRHGDQGIWSVRLPKRLAPGRHRLSSTAVDATGRSATSTLTVRSCRR